MSHGIEEHLEKQLKVRQNAAAGPVTRCIRRVAEIKRRQRQEEARRREEERRRREDERRRKDEERRQNDQERRQKEKEQAAGFRTTRGGAKDKPEPDVSSTSSYVISHFFH